ncbi:MAG: valine--tRNA ligase [Candidatus Pacebacteria bacterium]|nr:valine--tRNA ligase [Candidatus Paceibacterota bacterium]MDD5013222.1 valine--tRNA ligase [Candidatus Paceibacterota bacterium]MDD5752701.1 valine--tRNA ligase [Candidatus Paceibacterota bacterium]
MKELPKDYDFKATESKWKTNWEKSQLYKFKENNGSPLFVVDTPPPYVSADHLHAGHIMSYTQAEFIVRYKRMKGFNVFYPMGFDDNGLPTERYVEKKYKIDKSKITKSEFIKLCLKETEEGIKTYKRLWTNLGISVDWSKTYSTIAPLPTKVSQWSLIDLYKKGFLKREEVPILWCPYCQTAISQSDTEDKERESVMNYISFDTNDNNNIIIATTRPELLPACVALYYNPKDERYKGLEQKKAIVPLFNYEIPIKTSEAVDQEKGTGLMMVCTWGDTEDLEKWRLDKLETRSLLTTDGKLNELGENYQGLTITEARKKILEDLKDSLIRQEKITQIVNVHERCDTPVELIQSKQWFIKISDMKDTWLEYGKKINWHPEHMYKNYELWVNSLKWDWCVSRQRYYGVPFPFWYCNNCNEVIFPNEKDLPVDPTESKPKQCPKCKSNDIVPETDVMDTWATSSCTPFLLKELGNNEKLFPVDLRPNAHEIIRTWDFYSIVKGYYNFNQVPFKNIMISGHGLDEKGKKISKRLGNYVSSDQLIEEYGADAVRYWATGASLGQNLRFNPKEIKKGKQITIKLWNVARFIQMNEINTNSDVNLEQPDLWIISETNKTIKTATKHFESFEYAKAKNEIETFFMSKFADYYIEFVKYRLNENNKESKKAAQYTLYTVFTTILKLYAPLIPFITEEIYHLFTNEKSIHVSFWPELITHKEPDKDFEKAIEAIDEIRKYKSENKISLGKEIEEYKIKTSVDLNKYKEFIQKAIKVKEIKNTPD